MRVKEAKAIPLSSSQDEMSGAYRVKVRGRDHEPT